LRAFSFGRRDSAEGGEQERERDGPAQQRWKRARLSRFLPRRQEGGCCLAGDTPRLLSPLSPCLSPPWPFCDGSGPRPAAVITLRAPVASARRRPQKRALRTIHRVSRRKESPSEQNAIKPSRLHVRVRSHASRGERRKLHVDSSGPEDREGG